VAHYLGSVMVINPRRDHILILEVVKAAMVPDNEYEEYLGTGLHSTLERASSPAAHRADSAVLITIARREMLTTPIG
jgi:hypothetical protein